MKEDILSSSFPFSINLSLLFFSSSLIDISLSFFILSWLLIFKFINIPFINSKYFLFISSLNFFDIIISGWKNSWIIFPLLQLIFNSFSYIFGCFSINCFSNVDSNPKIITSISFHSILLSITWGEIKLEIKIWEYP